MRRYKPLSRQRFGDLRSLAREVDMKSFEYTFPTDDGSSSVAVYIPRFTIPAGVGWESGGFPGDDLHLGGFWFDKYQCSHKSATDSSRGIGAGPTISPGSTTDVAVSQYRKVVWTDIDWYNSKAAIENRYTDGRQVSQVSIEALDAFFVDSTVEVFDPDSGGWNSVVPSQVFGEIERYDAETVIFEKIADSQVFVHPDGYYRLLQKCNAPPGTYYLKTTARVGDITQIERLKIKAKVNI